MSVSSRFPPEVTAWMERWRLLRDGELLTTHSSWILPVRQGDMPAMLKVARIPDEEAGYRLLTWWDGQGAARVFASAAGALLMERASGAGDLAQIAWSGQDDEACRILRGTSFVYVPSALNPADDPSRGRLGLSRPLLRLPFQPTTGRTSLYAVSPSVPSHLPVRVHFASPLHVAWRPP